MAHHHGFHANNITTTEMLSFLVVGVGWGREDQNATQLSMQAYGKNTIHSKITAPKGTRRYYTMEKVLFFTLILQATLLTIKRGILIFFIDKIIRKKGDKGTV